VPYLIEIGEYDEEYIQEWVGEVLQESRPIHSQQLILTTSFLTFNEAKEVLNNSFNEI